MQRIVPILTCTLLLGASLYAAEAQVVTQAQPAVIFDIHGVLTRVAPWQMTKAVMGALLRQPSLIFKLNPWTFTSGEYAKYPALRAIYNCHTLHEPTWELARKLKAAGYPLYTFSNIVDKTFEEYKTKHPGYFELFDGCHVVPTENAALRKPTAEAFATCKAFIAQKHPQSPLILIDNKKSNIIAAQEAGFSGVVFSSAAQAQRELASHGIVV